MKTTTETAITEVLHLSGMTHEFEDLDIDALVRPLGLSGQHAIIGLDLSKEDECALQRPQPPFRNKRDAQKQMDAYWAAHRMASMFIVELTPEMTAFHLMRLAAQEYKRRFPVGGWHIFFEYLYIQPRVIEFGMGS